MPKRQRSFIGRHTIRAKGKRRSNKFQHARWHCDFHKIQPGRRLALKMRCDATAATRIPKLSEHRSGHRKRDATATAAARAIETLEEWSNRLEAKTLRRNTKQCLERLCSSEWVSKALPYCSRVDYANYPAIHIGSVSIEYQFCNAVRWSGEPAIICCSIGNICLAHLEEPHQNLSLFSQTQQKTRDRFYVASEITTAHFRWLLRGKPLSERMDSFQLLKYKRRSILELDLSRIFQMKNPSFFNYNLLGSTKKKQRRAIPFHLELT